MIIEMNRVRLLGPRARLGDTLAALQDLGAVHLVEPVQQPGLSPHGIDPSERTRRRRLERALDDVEEALAGVTALGGQTPEVEPEPAAGEGAAALAAHRLRVRVDRMRERERTLVDERDALRIYEPLLLDLDAIGRGGGQRWFSAYLLRLHGVGAEIVGRFRAALDDALDGEYDLRVRSLPGGETALLLLVAAGRTEEADRMLEEARVEAAPVPPGFGGRPLIDVLQQMRPRLRQVEHELADLRDDAAALAAEALPTLCWARQRFHDQLIELDARTRSAETAHAFVVEGWLPARELPALRVDIDQRLDGDVTVEQVAKAEWYGQEAPVVLSNPRIFEPFERVTALLPLPRYGTVDPTPFVAVFFPMLFGIVVGDVGYGAMMMLLALIIRWRSAPGGMARDISKIAAAVASFTLIFGVLYGELFGDLGERLFGMRALWLDREEAVVPFLALAVALGLVHLLLGLLLSAINKRRSRPREALGAGLTLVMLALIALALLTAFELLPKAFFTPVIVALLVAFPLLIAVEGFTAPLELLSIVGHVLSYARVMALGTASVMLAVVANRMVGAFGSVVVGVLFALLFHLVNFAIALFSPTIHVLRLHYVEFFETFYSPGGSRYQPLAHWSPEPAASS